MITPFEAGFSSYVKLHKPFFVGRSQCVDAYRGLQRGIVRFSVEPGSRPVREGAAVLDRAGTMIGRVTSCVSLGDQQIGLALLERGGMAVGTSISILNPSRSGSVDKTPAGLEPGERITVPVPGTIIPRFMARIAVPQDGGE
jgi:glycine hydroxymethyltransferase